ncbi:hypothetical protein [Chryseobacterium sp. ERMR1:04]|uniref:hypothetical protein n=1 Tax=Chryseobacterium sp. ERMR1:04 TaxID=1705393 RepID=UPI0006C8B9C7|nr:hypothetical protein [Chryseobacterium sp. ERMR1:04]KPH15145.1 hypothetical protein AMQ68_07050 [Chryseobacterium sp. ERMR1:04]
MNLNNYNIINHKIDFNNFQYINLQTLLNSNFNNLGTLNRYLNELLYLKKNWNNISLRNSYIENNLNGYWDGETLHDNNVTGNWFMIIGYDDLTGYINADTKVFYLENSILTNLPIIQLPLEEFIDVLQQWNVILDN